MHIAVAPDSGKLSLSMESTKIVSFFATIKSVKFTHTNLGLV